MVLAVAARIRWRVQGFGWGEHVGNVIGAIARPDDIRFTAALPKTRSGKIMRRLLRDIAEGRALGDVTTLRDPAVMAELQSKVTAEQATEG